MAFLSYIWDPKINNYVNIGGSDYTKVYYDTTAGWNSKAGLIAQKQVLYIYTDGDSYEDVDGTIKNLPSIKIGDGTTYLVDLPAITTNIQTIQQFREHVENTDVHVTNQERLFWNEKCRVDESLSDQGILMLRTD